MDRYELKEELGDGSFGRVVKAQHKETGDVVAIKHIKCKIMSWNEIMNSREVQSLRKLSHPNIVHMTEVILERDENLYFAFEYMAGGSLHDLTKACMEDIGCKKPNLLTNNQIRIFVRQILSALSYIHGEGFVHRDIKPENILLNESRTACKVADFGLAREAQEVGMTYYVSTRWYRAPEVILRCPYGKPVDVFATGLCLAELCCLRPLFPGATEIDQISKMVELFGPPTEWEEGAARMRQLNFRLVNTAESEHIEWAESVIKSDAPRHLIEQMLSWNPASRPSAETALQCEYFQSKESDMALSRTGTDQSKSNIGIRAKQVQETTDAEPTWHGILRDEFVIEQSSVPHPGIGKSDANSFLSLSGTNQPEDNEFSQYLDAISSTTHGEVGHNLQSGSRSKPSGNHCRRFNVESKPNSGIAPRLFQHGGSDQSTSGAAGVLDGLPAERGAKRPIPYRRFGHDKRTAERPQWLLSNQSIGKRAMEVRITRPKHVDEMNPDNLDRYELPSTPFRSGE